MKRKLNLYKYRRDEDIKSKKYVKKKSENIHENIRFCAQLIDFVSN